MTAPHAQCQPGSAPAETAVCRHCGLALCGKPYRFGGSAYHPRTGERCPSNHYGGFVCSENCDRQASLALERSMPGHGVSQMSIGTSAHESLNRNWNRS
jgi:hypothetical protein